MYLGLFPNREYAVGAVSGAAASFLAVGITHPIESVKARMQSGEQGPAGSHWWTQFRSIVHRPYYGVGTQLLYTALVSSVRFGSFDAAEKFFAGSGGASGILTLSEVFLCGAFSGACMAASLHPCMVVKIHQQINRIGPGQAVQQLWKGEGLRGLFRTYGAAFVRFPISGGVFFTVYEAIKRADRWCSIAKVDKGPISQSSAAARQVGASVLAGLCSWNSVLPIDVVQSRVIGEAQYGAARKYPGILSCFRTLCREEGLRAFTRGYSALLLRSGPGNGILVTAKDALMPKVQRLLPPA